MATHKNKSVCLKNKIIAYIQKIIKLYDKCFIAYQIKFNYLIVYVRDYLYNMIYNYNSRCFIYQSYENEVVLNHLFDLRLIFI